MKKKRSTNCWWSFGKYGFCIQHSQVTRPTLWTEQLSIGKISVTIICNSTLFPELESIFRWLYDKIFIWHKSMELTTAQSTFQTWILNTLKKKPFKVNESRHKQRGVTPHFYIYCKKIINYWLRKMNIDTNIWEKLFNKFADHK